MKLILTFILLIAFSQGFSQNGYFGSKHAISFKIDASPTILPKHELQKKKTVAKIANRYAYSNYWINYSLIASKRIILHFGYGFNRLRLQTQNMYFLGSLGSGGQILEDPKINLHQMSFEFNYYRNGNLAPLGKYIGFKLKYGISKMSSNKRFHVGIRDVPNKSNFLHSKHDIVELNTYYPNSDSTFQFFQINLQLGRSYPLSNKMTFSFGISIPLISTLYVHQSSDFSPSLDPFRILNDEVYPIHSDDLHWLPYLTLKKYNRYALEFSLSYFI